MNMHANGRIPLIATQPPKGTSWLARFGTQASTLLAARGPLLWLVLLASVVTIVGAAGVILQARDANDKIAKLEAGRDIDVAASARPALLEARAQFLLARDRLNEAQPLLDQAVLRADRTVQVRMLYNMANARVRAAVEAIQQGHFDQSVPQVALAKAEYRAALRLEPENWDVKYNLDVAMRLVRDLPREEGEMDEGNVKEPAKLWTDLPGVPKGLP